MNHRYSTFSEFPHSLTFIKEIDITIIYILNTAWSGADVRGNGAENHGNEEKTTGSGNGSEVKKLKKVVEHLLCAVKCSKPIDAHHAEHLTEAERLLK